MQKAHSSQNVNLGTFIANAPLENIEFIYSFNFIFYKISRGFFFFFEYPLCAKPSGDNMIINKKFDYICESISSFILLEVMCTISFSFTKNHMR